MQSALVKKAPRHLPLDYTAVCSFCGENIQSMRLVRTHIGHHLLDTALWVSRYYYGGLDDADAEDIDSEMDEAESVAGREQDIQPTVTVEDGGIIMRDRELSPSPTRERIRIIDERERIPSPSPPPPPPELPVIHIQGPTIEREIITHYRDIDHGR